MSQSNLNQRPHLLFFKRSYLMSFWILGLLSFNAVANEFDSRQVIELNQEHKAQLLSNMRGVLATTQSIITALAEDDMQAVADYARPFGFKARQKKASDGLHDALPKSFKMLGRAMHKSFDKIAEDAETIKDPKHSLKQLSSVLNSCQGCHATFQVESTSTSK